MTAYLTLTSLPRDQQLAHTGISRGQGILGHDIVPLTLGPHSSSFHEVARVLEPMASLDKGVMRSVDGEQTYVCGFTILFTVDMP